MAEQTQIVLAERPTGDIIPGRTFRTERVPKPDPSSLQDGQVLVEAQYLSLDPAMRSWVTTQRNYLPPVELDAVMRGVTVGVVVASKSARFQEGNLVVGSTGWREYAVVGERELTPVEVPSNGRTTDALNVLGMTGLTAYFGILDIGRVQAGDFVVVTGAAGATGSVVGQIAKLKGAYVLGIAGSDDKVQWLRDLGFDAALNYKSASFKADFHAATEGKYIDVFFDNVGGEILDMALGKAKEHARFVMCGGISQYNTDKPEGLRNYLMIIKMRIRMEGFIILDYVKRFGEARKELSQWLAEGKIQRRETVVKGGLEKAEQALVDLYKGKNTGKMLVEIKPQDSENKPSL